MTLGIQSGVPVPQPPATGPLHATARLGTLSLSLALALFFDTAVKSHFDQC